MHFLPLLRSHLLLTTSAAVTTLKPALFKACSDQSIEIISGIVRDENATSLAAVPASSATIPIVMSFFIVKILCAHYTTLFHADGRRLWYNFRQPTKEKSNGPRQ